MTRLPHFAATRSQLVHQAALTPPMASLNEQRETDFHMLNQIRNQQLQRINHTDIFFYKIFYLLHIFTIPDRYPLPFPLFFLFVFAFSSLQ